MIKNMIYYGFTECGPNRNINQDAMLLKALNNSGIFLVADGMGGHSHGEIASDLIVKRAGEWADTELLDENKIKTVSLDDISDSFEALIKRINEELRRDYSLEGVCGSTMVALLVADGKYAIFSVGDSRIYKKSGNEFIQMTQDHVWQNMPEVMNAYTEKERLKHSNYGKLTNAVGAYDHVKISMQTGKLSEGDVFMLCSDGVYKCLNDSAMKGISKSIDAKSDDCKFVMSAQLIKKYVEKKGAPDNYTAVLVGCLAHL